MRVLNDGSSGYWIIGYGIVVFSLQKKYNLIEFYSWAWGFLHTIIFNIIIYTSVLDSEI